jgi:hypothetical protein
MLTWLFPDIFVLLEARSRMRPVVVPIGKEMSLGRAAKEATSVAVNMAAAKEATSVAVRVAAAKEAIATYVGRFRELAVVTKNSVIIAT